MKNQTLLLALCVPLLFLLPACQPGGAHDHHHATEVNLDTVKAQIVALEAAYAAASNANDVEGIAQFYAADAQSLADGEATWVGKDAIKAGLKRDMDSDSTGGTISFETTGVWAAGNLAVETGTSTVKDSTGNVTESGKYMALYELRDGKYVCIRDIWNDDAPKK